MEDLGSVDREELVSSIVAENAILKVKIKHEYDLACTFAADINKVETDIEMCQRELKRCEEINELKTADCTRLREYLENVRASRERVQISIENLQRQHEMMVIEEEQCAKERDTVRANYEAMIRNQKDINNSYPIVVEKNKLQNELDSYRIQLAVLQRKQEDMLAKRRKLDEITNLRFQQAVVEFATKYIEARNRYKKYLELDNLLNEKRKKLEELKEAKQKNQMAENESNTSGEKFNLDNTIRTLFPRAWKSPFPVARKIPTMPFPKPGDTMKYLQQLNVLNKSRSSLMSSSMLSQSLPSKLESPFAQFRDDSRSQSTELVDKPMKSIVSDAYRDIDAEQGAMDVNDDAVDKNDTMDLPEINTTDDEINREKLTISPLTEILPEKLAAVELDTAENDANLISDDVTNQIGCMNLRQLDGDISQSSVSTVIGNVNETIIDNSASPKSRIPVLIVKDSPRVASNPYTGSNKNLPKISGSKSGEISENSLVSTVKEVNTPKRANVDSPKRAQKMAKIDHPFTQNLQARKPKQLLDTVSEPSTSRHAACKIVSELTKTSLNSPLKKFSQDKRMAAKNNAKMNLMNDESRSMFHLQSRTKTMRDLRINPRKQIMKESNSKMNVLEERHKNEPVVSVKAKKTAETIDSLNKFCRVAATEMVKNMDNKKRSPRAEVQKNKNLNGQSDDKSAMETTKISSGRRIEDMDMKSYDQKNEINDHNRSKYFTNEQPQIQDDDNHCDTNNVEDPSVNEDTYNRCSSVGAIFASSSGNSNSDNNDIDSFFSGLNETYTVRSPQSDNSSVPSFRSTNTEKVFEFGSSVTDIFGTDAEDVDQRDGFSFNFNSQPNNKPFRLF